DSSITRVTMIVLNNARVFFVMSELFISVHFCDVDVLLFMAHSFFPHASPFRWHCMTHHKKRTTYVCGSALDKYVVLLLWSDQLLLAGFFNRMYSPVDRKFAINALDMEFNRVETEEKLLSYLFIGLPGSQEAQHFELPIAQFLCIHQVGSSFGGLSRHRLKQ